MLTRCRVLAGCDQGLRSLHPATEVRSTRQQLTATVARCLVPPIISLTVVACGDDSGPTAPAARTPRETAPVAIEYLNSALDIMQENSLKRLEIDWPTFRARAFEFALGAQTSEETYGAIRFALSALGDHHSFFVPAGQTPAYGFPPPGTPSGQDIGGFGYIVLPGFQSPGFNDALATGYAERVQELIRTLDGPSRCGWVVDLRPNWGGNMWPMVAGIGPVLGEGLVGGWINVEGERSRWFYRDGVAGIELPSGSTVIMMEVGSPYQVVNREPPVAVLTAGDTASSGEAVTIAFRARPRTRSFGSATYGNSTGNAAFHLSDGARIFLTVSIMVDRDGTPYGGVIAPDEVVTGESSDPASDPVVSRAISWLAGRCQP